MPIAHGESLDSLVRDDVLAVASGSFARPWLRLTNPFETDPEAPLIRTLTGHTNSISALALSSDGKVAVSAGYDGTVRVWDVERGSCRAELAGHTAGILALALSSDGKVAVSAGSDRTVRVWDVERGSCRAELAGHTAVIRALALSSDGKVAVSAGSDRTVRVWDVERGSCRAELAGHTDRIRALALSSDGKVAVSAGDDRTVRVWDVERMRCITVFPCDYPLMALGIDMTMPCRVTAGDARGRFQAFRLENWPQ